jgi:carbon-monoxide dehydrogenase medium subunit
LRAAAVEEELAGGADASAASTRADEGTAPPDDAFASADYRRALVKVLTQRALQEAMA